MAVSMFLGLYTCHCLARGIYFLLVEKEPCPLPLKHIHTWTHMRAHTPIHNPAKHRVETFCSCRRKTTVSDTLVDTGPCDQNSLLAAIDWNGYTTPYVPKFSWHSTHFWHWLLEWTYKWNPGWLLPAVISPTFLYVWEMPVCSRSSRFTSHFLLSAL